jgi:hypothetical protein
MLHGLFGRIFGSQLGREGGAFPRTLEPLAPGAAPGEGITDGVGNGNYRIIESSLDMGYADRNVLFNFPA